MDRDPSEDDWEMRKPAWSTIPYCAFCHWDDVYDWEDVPKWSAEENAGYLTLGAFIEGPYPPESGLKPFGKGDWFDERHHVGWLCTECVNDDSILRWFVDAVWRDFPTAEFAANAGRPSERVLKRHVESVLKFFRDRRPAAGDSD